MAAGGKDPELPDFAIFFLTQQLELHIISGNKANGGFEENIFEAFSLTSDPNGDRSEEDYMHKFGKHATVFLLALSLVLVPCVTPLLAQQSQTFEKDRDAGAMFADLVFSRPISAVAMVLGTATFIVTIPLSGIGGNMDQAADKLVADPIGHTFNRPLGQFEPK